MSPGPPLCAQDSQDADVTGFPDITSWEAYGDCDAMLSQEAALCGSISGRQEGRHCGVRGWADLASHPGPVSILSFL